MPTPSLAGASYILTFIDDASRYVRVHFLEHKNDAFEAFQQYRTFTGKLSRAQKLSFGSEQSSTNSMPCIEIAPGKPSIATSCLSVDNRSDVDGCSSGN